MKKYILIAAASITLAACSNDDSYVDEPVAARFTATIGSNTMSRASETSWAPGDEIGITMGNRHVNIKHTAQTTDGEFSGSTTMYFRNKRDPETLTAYYPFAGTEGTTPQPVEISTTADKQTANDQPDIDFLYAIKENVTGAEPEVNFTFSHRMSKITLVFKNGNDGTDVGKIKSYTIDGLVLDGKFNPATGDCAAKTGSQAAPLEITPEEGSVKTGEELPSLIVFPQPAGSVTLKIKDNEEQDYICDLKFTGNSLEPGKNYLFVVSVKKTGLSLEKSGIDNWIPEVDPDAEAVSD